ncbi:MAG TPA: hypothetical protein VFW33_08640, partial [Gemmataceae bacterium]|nr:hypothetical protein [Gemmataceae bacterium]
KLRLRNIVVAALCLPDVETGPELQTGPDEPPPEGLDPVFRRRLLAWRALSRLPPPAFELRGVSWYSPDGRFVAVATEEYVKRVCVPARVWRIDGPTPVRVLDDEGPFEEATTFRPDSRQVAFGHADGTVRIYDTETGHVIRDLPPGAGAVNCLAYHPTLPRLAVAGNNDVAIWDVETGRRLVLLHHLTTACALAWHPRGHRLAVATYGRQIHLWDAESGRPITPPWQGATHEGIHLAFSPAGDRVASTEWYSVLRLWDAATGQQLLSERGHWLVSYGSDDRALGFEGNRVVRVAGGQELRTLLRPTPDGSRRVVGSSLHPGGRLLAVQTTDGCGLWDLLTGEELCFLPGRFATREGARFDATGVLWTFGDAGLLRWPVRPAAEPAGKLVVGPPQQVSGVAPRREHDGFACSADGRVAAVALDDDGALLIHRGPPRRTFRLGPQYDVRYVRLTPDGRRVVTTSHFGDGSGVFTKVWDAATGKLVADLPAEVRWETLRGLSPDGRWLHYSEGKQSKRLEIASLDEDPARPRSEPGLFGGAFSPDGALRAVGDAEGTIRLLAADAETEIARLPSPEQGAVWPTGFSPDGARLLAGGDESGALYVFDLRRLREQLADLGLDWDAAPYPPRKPEEARPAVDAPLRVELIGAGWAASRRSMAEYERQKAVAALVVNPFDADVHYRLGCLLLEGGRFAEARAHLTAALA